MSLPDGFHRIRHFGFLANAHRAARLAAIRALLDVPAPAVHATPRDYRERYHYSPAGHLDICPCCGGAMVEIATVARARPPSSPIWCDSS